MKSAGWILALLAATVVFYNIVVVKHFNEQQENEHPFAMFFSGGSILKRGYTFEPPYTGFEIFIIAMGVVGVVLIAIGSKKNPYNRCLITLPYEHEP